MPDKVTAPRVRAMKAAGERIVCITAYDAEMGRIVDEAGVDIVLVGDSVGNVLLGYDSTIPVTIEEMLHHTRATRRGVKRALLVADLPFGSYQVSAEGAVEAAVALVKAGAEAVKVEGSPRALSAIVEAGIPVMGHIGMTPQSVHAFGGFKVQGKGDGGDAVISLGKEVEAAGAFAVVLELVPSTLAQRITESLQIPTIGIGAGVNCDGQVQVANDMLGLSPHPFRHVKQFANLRQTVTDAVTKYASEVRAGEFPSESHSF